MAQTVKFQLRRDTPFAWAQNNPTLSQGEPGYEILQGATGNRLKIGDGTSTWNNLPYMVGGPTGPNGNPGQGNWSPVTVPPTNVRIGPTGGTFAKINGNVSGYDTAIRSAQTYLSGCYVSFNSPSVAGSEAIMGISSTPNPVGNTGIAPTDIQYGINYNQSGTTYGWYESGTSVTLADGCAPGDSFSIVYDGTNVYYYHNNLLVHTTVRATGQTGAFHLEGNFQSYGSVDNLVFGPLVSKAGQGGWTPTLYQMAQPPATAGTFNTTQLAAGWAVPNTSQMSSVQGFRQAYCSFSIKIGSNPPPSSYMGLSTVTTFANSPPPSQLWGICVTASPATIQIYENGAITQTISQSSASTDVFTTSYDGANFTYYKNGTLLGTTPYTLPVGSLLYLLGQHSQANSSFTNVVFAPGSKSPISGYTYHPYNATPQTIVIPSNVVGLDAILIGGGGGGGGGGGENNRGGGGGGAGYWEYVRISPPTLGGVTGLGGQTISYYVGAGGVGNSNEGGNGTDGNPGQSTWLTLNNITYEAPGGQPGTRAPSTGIAGNGGNGGSGGGGGGGTTVGAGGAGQSPQYNGIVGDMSVKGGVGGRSPFGSFYSTIPRPTTNANSAGGAGGGYLGGWSNTTGSRGTDGYGSGGGGRSADPNPPGVGPDGNNNGGHGGLYIRYYTV